MDLTACVICKGKNDTNRCHLIGFSEDAAFVHHFVATCPPTTLPPYRSATGIGYGSKHYLKWWKIQIAIHPIGGVWIDYK